MTQDRGGVLVAHASQRWKRPRRLVLDGIALVEARGGRAVVRVAPRVARALGCPAGAYRVPRDSSVGRARVLAVLEDLLLLERDGRLRYVKVGDEATHPRWLMAWGSRYEVRLRRASAASSRAGKRRPRRRKSKARRRGRRVGR